MDEQPSLTDPSIEVMRHTAIMSIYRQLSDMTLTTAEDALDAASALLRLDELDAEGWMIDTD